jgi:hypothetical protein
MWQDLAIAVGSRLEFERKCGRGGLLDESTAVRCAAEYLQAVWNGQINVNEPHDDMPGKFIDLVGTKPRGNNLGLALEAKWLKDDGGTRQWLKEVTVDIFRLQHFTTNVAQNADRVILVAGIRSMIQEKLATYKVDAGGGSTLGIKHVLPTRFSQDFAKFDIRNADVEARNWFKLCHKKLDKTLGTNLPSTYNARLAGHYRTWKGIGAVEVLVWLTRRPQGWGSFNPTVEWP